MPHRTIQLGRNVRLASLTSATNLAINAPPETGKPDFRLPEYQAAAGYYFPNLIADRSFAFAASISRSRDGAFVCKVFSISCAAAETRSNARLKASWLATEGLFIPDNFLTNCNAEAFTSSLVAGGSKLKSVLMLRHIRRIILAFLCQSLSAHSRVTRAISSKTSSVETRVFFRVL